MIARLWATKVRAEVGTLSGNDYALLRPALIVLRCSLLHTNAALGLDLQGLEMARIFLPCARHPCRSFLQSTSRVPRLQKVRTPNYFGSASQEPSDAASSSITRLQVVFRLLTEQLCEANAALHLTAFKSALWLRNSSSVPTSHKLGKAMDSTASSEPLTPRSTGAPAMIERRSSFVLEGASTKLVDDLAKAAAAARANAILGRAEFVRRSSSIGEEAEVAAAA